MHEEFADIKNAAGWESVEPVSKGWSDDRKYFIRAKEGKRLLRISDIEHYSAKKKEYEVIAKYAGSGFAMSLPLDFGICNRGKNVYMLLTWVEGRDLEDVLPELPEKEQYRLGREAGAILRKIHSIEVNECDMSRDTKKAKKLLQISRYEESRVRVDGDEPAIRFIRENIDRIWKQKPVYLHGDYHPGNLIYTGGGHIGVIDFNRWEVGDPYEEFYKLESFGIEISIPYCIGQIDAYFDDRIPDDFWKALAVYAAHAAMNSICWAEKFGQDAVDKMTARCRTAFLNYDHFQIDIPKWYTDRYSGEFLRETAGKM